jgi:flagellar biosynthesis/type III secretory pathway protein FliH
MPHKEILRDLRSECPCENLDYCPLEAIVETTQGNDRFLEQHKCIEIFKFLESRKDGKDIGWNESYARWCREGYAKAFAEVYQEGMKHKELYQGIIKIMETQK